MSVEDVAGGLRRAVGLIREGIAAAERGRAKLAAAKTRLDGLLRDSARRDQIVGPYEPADEAIARALRGSAAVVETVTDYVVNVLGADVGGGTTSATTRTMPAEERQWRPKPIRAAVDEIRPHVGAKIAAGRLYDEHGEALTGVYGPGEPGPGTGGRGLRPSWREMPSVTRHVEGHAAAMMRHQRITRAVLYINMKPCTPEQRPDSCSERIREALPVGYTLVVYEVRANGTIRVHRFEGTGEGIE